MKQRWRALLHPDGEHSEASPTAGEAFGVWMLGILWALVCLWLGYLADQWIVPGLLLAGLLALWGWSRFEWLWWFPVVLVVATLLEPFAPLSARGRYGPLDYVDLLALWVVVVAIARAVGGRRRLVPRTAVDGLALTLFGFVMVNLLASADRARAFADLKDFAVAVVVFYATTAVASRPRGSRWVWSAFPLTSALIGTHALWAAASGPGTLSLHVALADALWGSEHGVFNALIVALPVCAGLTLNAGRPAVRAAWGVAGVGGATALVFHLDGTSVVGDLAAGAAQPSALDFWRWVMTAVVLGTLARFTWMVRAGRRHEGPRWMALGLMFLLYGLLQASTPPLSGPSARMVAVAAGLTVGTWRADRRARSSSRPVVPALSRAA